MGEFDGERIQTARPKKEGKVAREEHRKVRAQALVPQESIPPTFALQAYVFDKYRLHEKLKAVLLLCSDVLLSVDENGHER